MSAYGKIRQETRVQILDCICAHPDGLAVRDICGEVGLDSYEVRKHIVKLHNIGAIEPADTADRRKVWRCGENCSHINRRKVAECIASHPEGIESKVIGAELGMDRYEVKRHMGRLRENGAIVRIEGSKRWRTAE